MTATYARRQRRRIIMRASWRDVRKRVSALIGVLLLAPATGCVGHHNTVKPHPHPTANPPPKLQRVATLHFGFEKPGVEFEEVVNPDMVPTRAELAVRSGRTTRIVRDFKELVGLVQITSPEAALKYVRFWAVPGAEAYIPFEASVEIVDLKRFLHMRDMAGNPNELPQVVRGDFHSGLEGILSEAAYHASPFTPPQVKQSPAGFTITRWVYLSSRAERVMQIREVVHTDGSYQRVVCKQMPPPKLQNTVWGIVSRL